MTITAKLKNAYRIGDVYFGDIYGDTRGRFSDGTPVRTSKVLSVNGNLVTTQNSIYEIIHNDFVVAIERDTANA